MGAIIGETSGYSTWARLRTAIMLPGSGGIFTSNNSVYENGFAFHAGFKTDKNTLMRGDKGANAAYFGFSIGSGGNYYFYSSFFTGTGGNTTNSIDESHALALVGQTVVLDGGTTFTITADYKDTLDGQLVLTPSPPGPGPTSFDVDQVGLLTAFDS